MSKVELVYEKHEDKRIEQCNKLIAVHDLIRRKYWLRYFFMSDYQKYKFRCKIAGVAPAF